MRKQDVEVITVKVTVHAPVEKVWKLWTDPEHIIRWSSAAGDWHTPRAENDLRPGGRFFSRMEAKDGSTGFDFGGEYTRIEQFQLIEYRMDDGRNVLILFDQTGSGTIISESFEAEESNPVDMQRTGWQAILDNFKDYAEKLLKLKTLHFQINISAPSEKVYSTLIDDKSYRDWTSVFNPASHFKGTWEKGSEMQFIGTDKDGNEGGMASRIKENIPNKYISIEHLGSLKNGEEETPTPETDPWSGAHENYTFVAGREGTLLIIDLDTLDQYGSYFETMWPKALSRLKEICER